MRVVDDCDDDDFVDESDDGFVFFVIECVNFSLSENDVASI